MTTTTAPVRRRTVQRKHQPSLGELVFMPTFILLVAIHCIENTSLNYYPPAWMPVIYLYRNLLYGILLVKIVFLSTYRDKEIWAVLAVLAGAAVCYLCTRDLQMIEWVTIAIAAKNVPKQRLLYAFLLTKAAAIALTLLLYEVGVLPTLYYFNSDNSVYNTMGFCHRNVLGANMAVLCLGWFYLRFRNLTILDVLFWLVISAVTYFLAISRTSLIIMVLIVVVMYAFRKLDRLITATPQLRWIFPGIFVAMFLVCFLCACFYQKYDPMWSVLDDIFTKRISFANRVMEDHGLSLFGQDLPFVTTMAAQISNTKSLILDNAYMRAMLFFGIIPGLTFMGLYALTIFRSCEKKRTALVAALLVMAVFGLSESYMLDVFYNFPLLLGLTTLFRRPAPEEAQRPVPYVLRSCWDWSRAQLKDLRKPEREPKQKQPVAEKLRAFWKWLCDLFDKLCS